jgi:hypothetical protein
MGLSSSNSREDLDALLRESAEIDSRDKRGGARAPNSNVSNQGTINLVGFNVSRFEDLQLSQEGANARITFADGSSIVLRNRQVSELSADQFCFDNAGLVASALHRRSTRSLTEPTAEILAELTAIETAFVPAALLRPRSVTDFAADMRPESVVIGPVALRNLAADPLSPPHDSGAAVSATESVLSIGRPLELLPSFSFAFASPRARRATPMPVTQSMDRTNETAIVGAELTAAAPGQKAEQLVQAMAAFSPASAGTAQFAFAERQISGFTFAASP